MPLVIRCTVVHSYLGYPDPKVVVTGISVYRAPFGWVSVEILLLWSTVLSLSVEIVASHAISMVFPHQYVCDSEWWIFQSYEQCPDPDCPDKRGISHSVYQQVPILVCTYFPNLEMIPNYPLAYWQDSMALHNVIGSCKSLQWSFDWKHTSAIWLDSDYVTDRKSMAVWLNWLRVWCGVRRSMPYMTLYQHALNSCMKGRPLTSPHAGIFQTTASPIHYGISSHAMLLFKVKQR